MKHTKKKTLPEAMLPTNIGTQLASMATTNTKSVKNHCPCCGMKSSDKNPAIYTCVECGTQGYDCCVPGNNAICMPCSN